MKKKWVSQQNQSSELFSNFLKNVFVYDIIAFAKTLLASLRDFFFTSATIITSYEFFFSVDVRTKRKATQGNLVLYQQNMLV